ncbi:unnamed protein product, partial [Choristocarpus tenellus]
PYREAVGSLIWLDTTTRPDIANVVMTVTRFSGNPGQRHWKVVKQILR